MAGFPLGAIATGLGQFAQQYQKQQEQQRAAELQRLRVQQFMQEQQDRQRQQEASGLAFGAIRAGAGDGGESGLTGSLPGATRMPDLDATPQGGGGSYMPSPSGSGFASGLRQLTELGVRPEVAQGAIDYMARNESGQNPNAVNPTSGATGRAQWLGPRKVALTSQYGDKPTDPQQAAFMGSELQGPERKTLDNLRTASTGQEGYNIWGRDYERPGAAALAKAGVPAQFHQQAQQTAQQTAQSIPPTLYGRVSLPALAQQIEKANPGADPVVKMMALEHVQKLLAPDQRMQWEMFKQQHDDKLKMMLQDRADVRQDKTIAAQQQHQDQRDDAAERRLDKTLSAKATAGADAKLSGDAVSTMADQYLAGDRTVMQNLGRGAQGSQNIVALRAEIAKKMAERGMSGADMATKMAEFEGLKAGERTLTQRTANIGMRIAEAKTFAPLALAASERVDRTQFPTLNSLLLAAEKGTGGEDVVRLSVATMSLLNAYAAAVTPTGTPTEGAQSRAHELLDKAWSQGQYRVAIDQLMMEMEAASKSPGMVREEFRRGADPVRSTAAPATSPPGAPVGLPADLPDPAGHAEGSVAKDESGKPVAVIRGGKWAAP